jgi:5-methylcytosine-specific restriction endonuclease McrA
MLQAVPKPSHKRRVPKRYDRGKFSKDTRQKILLRDDGVCQQCGGIGTQIHHVVPKGSGKGRGVYENGLTVCNDCHTQIHKDNDLLEYWIDVFTDKYGYGFWKDAYDHE